MTFRSVGRTLPCAGGGTRGALARPPSPSGPAPAGREARHGSHDRRLPGRRIRVWPGTGPHTIPARTRLSPGVRGGAADAHRPVNPRPVVRRLRAPAWIIL